MSIINDALKKARKNFEVNNFLGARPSADSENKRNLPSRKNRMIKLIFAVALLTAGLAVVYDRVTTLPGTTYSPAEISSSSADMPQSPLSRPETKTPKVEKAVPELNGIVYEPEDKWAIIDDEIVREGDSVTGGKIFSIGEDFVEIERDSGERLTLRLR